MGRLDQGGYLAPGVAEAIVVDNGSTDHTPAALANCYPNVKLISLPANEGVSARNHAFPIAQGRTIVLIDDDSYPEGDAIERSADYLDAHPEVGAVGGRVLLPDDSAEASAFPTVIINCAVCLRKSAIDKVGGFPREFFRQAEEYDLSFRLWQAGQRVVRFEDIIYRHEKAPGNRAPGLVCRMDLRNNLILAERYLPSPWREAYRADWALRYGALAKHLGHAAQARCARWEARGWAWREALRGRQTLSPAALEAIFGFQQQARRIEAWAHKHCLKRVAIADFGKNLFATFQACRAAGLEILAVADSHPAFAGLSYRGLPIASESAALARKIDGIVLSNINPAQVARRAASLAQNFPGPVLQLWEPLTLAGS